jgi:hypothetical protein
MKPCCTALGLLLALTAILPSTATAQFAAPGYYRGYYPGYYPGYYMNANTGNLYGTSQIINSQGKFLLQTQQAKLMDQDVKQTKLDTRRKTLEEWKYERDTLPTTEDERERTMAAELRRSRGDPPITEISSGYSLNVLLKDLQKLQVGPISVSPVVLNQDALKRINLTGSPKEISVGLFRGTGTLEWPFALRDPFFNSARKQIESLSQQAIGQAKSGSIDFQTLNSLNNAIDGLDADLRAKIADIPSNRWVECKRFVNQLKSSSAAFEDSSIVKNYAKWQPQGNTVGELVKYMTDQGLKFAAANAGDEAAYQSIYRSMSDYDVVLAQRTMTAYGPLGGTERVAKPK